MLLLLIATSASAKNEYKRQRTHNIPFSMTRVTEFNRGPGPQLPGAEKQAPRYWLSPCANSNLCAPPPSREHSSYLRGRSPADVQSAKIGSFELSMEDKSISASFPDQPSSIRDLSIEDVPEAVKNAFLTQEELLNTSEIQMKKDPTSEYVYNHTTHQLLTPDLSNQVVRVETSLLPGGWRTMTLLHGCCPVLRFHASNITLENINGQEKRIVHFSDSDPPRYQFIPHGLCKEDTKTYSSNGHCMQGKVTMSLLVYDVSFSPPITFDLFQIPSFCNCVQY
ncbi:uncharacterized protein LOC101852611 [Aplysia californica]|uniref:Uncharacterized protein LOC101852611 n=1 Tax=Aplysia californica TaxID=6500 RepID=A0ABM0JIP3_APLCA|nr:uncharacterized protein LOC101852611 [Aplysia californica]